MQAPANRGMIISGGNRRPDVVVVNARAPNAGDAYYGCRQDSFTLCPAQPIFTHRYFRSRMDDAKKVEK
ncbi:unnamed protein product [Mycena citricolor]|uniref:Uncharacterized protein n=1 Tax=Mycena citricolor TaxID=2018698 RepID=A0AAD2HVW8_9AGAR|nr:unnamed protein product [Mycena citricolor]